MFRGPAEPAERRVGSSSCRQPPPLRMLPWFSPPQLISERVSVFTASPGRQLSNSPQIDLSLSNRVEKKNNPRCPPAPPPPCLPQRDTSKCQAIVRPLFQSALKPANASWRLPLAAAPLCASPFHVLISRARPWRGADAPVAFMSRHQEELRSYEIQIGSPQQTPHSRVHTHSREASRHTHFLPRRVGPKKKTQPARSFSISDSSNRA